MSEESNNMAIADKKTDGLIRVNIQINNVKTEATIDTGATKSIISETMCKANKWPIQPCNKKGGQSPAGGTESGHHHSKHVTLANTAETIRAEFLVAKLTHADVLLGLDIFEFLVLHYLLVVLTIHFLLLYVILTMLPRI